MLFFILVSHFRHKRTIHDSSRDFVQIIENVPFAVKSIICPDRNVRILNYDIIAEEDLKCEIIKHFLSKDYVLLITSFSVKRQNLPKQYNKKNVLQKIKYVYSLFKPFLSNFFLKHEESKIEIFRLKSFFDTDIKIKTDKLRFYHFSQLYTCIEHANKGKYWKNNDFFYNLFNLDKSIFIKFFNVCLKIRSNCTPIFYSTLVNKCDFNNVLNKRLRKSCPQLPNSYMILKSTFDQIWNFFPEITSLFNFFQMAHVSLLKKERFSSVYYRFPISNFDQILEQCYMVDCLFAKTQLEEAVSRENVINSAFDRINLFELFPCSKKICEKSNLNRINTFYGQSFNLNMNTYSKIYILNTVILSENGFQTFTKKEIQKIINSIKGRVPNDMSDFHCL